MGRGEALVSLLFPKPDGGARSWDLWVSREEKTRSGIKRPAEPPGGQLPKLGLLGAVGRQGWRK